MTKFIIWFKENQAQITWWTIGWLSFATVDCLMKGDYILAAVDAGLAGYNYYIWKRQ